MTWRRLLRRNLTGHWRGNLAVFLGVAVATAVLTGALLVGDSLRGSLHDLTIRQLGWVDHVLIGQHFIREELAGQLGAEHACPAILLQGSANRTSSDGEASGHPAVHVGRVTILGVTEQFWLQGQAPLDREFWRPSEPELADFRNRSIGFVFQDHHLLPQCSVLENVLIPTLVSKDNASETETWARQLLERVGLSGRLDHRPAELSGGERQRVALARALIHRPSLLLADEPTGNLDRRSAQAVGQLLLDLHRQEQTILVVVTHSPELAKMFVRKMEMIDGRLEALEE